MKEFTLYMADAPSRATNVLWGLEECDADYDVVALSFGGSMKAPEYLAINPLGKVPALKHKGAVLTETAAVLTYLAEQFPAKKSDSGRWYAGAGAILPLAVFCLELGIRGGR